MPGTGLLEKWVEKRGELVNELEALTKLDDFDPENPEYVEKRSDLDGTDKRIAAIRDVVAQQQRTDDWEMTLRRADPPPQANPLDDTGDLILRSHLFRDWIRNGASGRRHVATKEMNYRALITTTTFPSGTGGPIYAQPPSLVSPLLATFGNIQSEHVNVDIMTYGPVPPAGAVAEGAPKPEATLSITPSTVSLGMLAHWVKCSRQALLNDSYLRDLISNSLMRGVTRKAEADAGLVLVGGSYGTAIAGADFLESVRLGVAEVQSRGYQPNAIVINPADAASLDFALWGYGNGVNIAGSVFGVTLVATATVPAGSAFVGDLKNGAAFIYMSGVQLYVTDSDVSGTAGTATSDFRANILTFLAEQMSKSVIVDPNAIVKCTPTVAMSTGYRGGGGAPTTRRGAEKE
jgi:hypothetical protein